MANFELYPVQGTVRAEPQRPNAVDADMFGGAAGRALEGFGRTMQGVGGRLLEIEEREKAKADTNVVSELYTEGTAKLREGLWGQNGLYTRVGTNAEGVSKLASEKAEAIYKELSGKLQTPEQKQALANMWRQHSEGVNNQAAKYEFDQRQQTATAAKTGAIANLEAEAIVNYNDQEMLDKNFDAARKFIRANADGLPADRVAQLERESISAMHVSVIQRMALDSPGRALDYYKAHKGEVNGADHAKVDSYVGQVAQMRQVRDDVAHITGTGAAGDIVHAVVGAESGGDPAAVSAAGAGGLMQVMPDTARAEAAALGMTAVAGMTDDQLIAHWQTPQGERDNLRIGTTFLGKQLNTFGGDLEAALVAYNAGPANATKWLNAGRDYSALPKPQETLPYVQKVMSRYLGVDVSAAGGSADIQRAAKGGGSAPAYQGDAAAFLKTKLQPQHGPQSIDEMQPVLRQRLAAFMSSAPDFVREGLDILSGYRTVQRQTELWNASDKSGRRVGSPTGSQHVHGNAADLGWKGGGLSTAPREVVEWIAANAGAYGLKLPVPGENWHVEPVETRGGKRASTRHVGLPSGPGYLAGNYAPVGGGGTVMLADPPAGAADVYTRTVGPFMAPSMGSEAAWLRQAEDRYADNPAMLAEAQRQIRAEWAFRDATLKQELVDLQKEAFGEIIGGKSVSDLDPLMLQKLGPEKVSTLLTLESKFRKGADEDKTDDAEYYRISKMSPEEFGRYNLLDSSAKLSGADLRSLADRQREILQPKPSAAKRETDQTRAEILRNAEDQLALKPDEKPADAEKLAALNRALNGKIAAFIETNKKEPTGDEMQLMVDDLLIKDTATGGMFGGEGKRFFELSPEERANFAPADEYEDIPAELVAPGGLVPRMFRNINGDDPTKEQAVDLYNDLRTVQLGEMPAPPDDVSSRIKQAFATKKGRPATADELRAVYSEWLRREMAAPAGPRPGAATPTRTAPAVIQPVDREAARAAGARVGAMVKPPTLTPVVSRKKAAIEKGAKKYFLGENFERTFMGGDPNDKKNWAP